MSAPDTRPWHYLDHAASAPVRPEVVALVGELMASELGNPSGAHALARRARNQLDDARERLAAVAGCRPGEVVFTSGGTEADNLAVNGTVAARPGAVVVSAIEHHAVLDPAARHQARVVPVDRTGRVDLDALADLVDADTTLVSVGLVNNETGTVQDLAAVAEVVRERAPEARLHTDAAQALLWLDVAAHSAPADLITLASHKAGGPKGIGALVVRDGATLVPQQLGGGQERERRSGTQDVVSACGFALAAERAATERDSLAARVGPWRDRLANEITKAVPGSVESAAPHGDRSHLVPGIVNLCLPDVDSEALLFLLEHDHRVLASAASSCASGAQEPSHVLAALGLDRRLTAGSLRLSLGWSTAAADVDAAVAGVPQAANALAARARQGAPA